MSKADALKPKEINRVLETCEIMQSKEVRRAAIVLSHAGLRVSEIGLLETKSVITRSGQLRSEMMLPAKSFRNTSIFV